MAQKFVEQTFLNILFDIFNKVDYNRLQKKERLRPFPVKIIKAVRNVIWHTKRN